MLNYAERGLENRINAELACARDAYRKSLQTALDLSGYTFPLSQRMLKDCNGTSPHTSISLDFISPSKETDIDLSSPLSAFVHLRERGLGKLVSIQEAHMGFNVAILSLRDESGKISRQRFDLLKSLGPYSEKNGAAVMPSAMRGLADTAMSISRSTLRGYANKPSSITPFPAEDYRIQKTQYLHNLYRNEGIISR